MRNLFWTLFSIFVILLIAWIVLWAVGIVLHGLVHLILVAAVIVLIISLVKRRGPA